MSPPSSTTSESIVPAPGTWVTQGDVPADFNPTSSDSGTRTDSDCTYRDYCWSFGGTAPYHQHVFSATLNTTIELNGKAVSIYVGSDDNATVSLGGIGSAASSLHNLASETFFKSDGSSYTGSFPLSVSYNTIGGPWFIEVRIRVYTPLALSPSEECSCRCQCDMASSVANGSVDFTQPFGGTPFAEGFPKGALRLYNRLPTYELFSGSGLRYVHPMTRRVTHRSGNAVIIEDALGHVYSYENGIPSGTAIWTDHRVSVLADNRLVETLADRTQITYLSDGSVEKIRSSEGVELSVSQLGIEPIFNTAGDLVQVWSLTDGLLNIVKISPKQFRADWYKPADVGPKDTTTGLYTFSGTTIKTFAFGDLNNDGSCAEFELLETRTGTDFAFHYTWRYNSKNQDWVLVRGNAGASDSETSRKEKHFSVDENGNPIVTISETKKSGTGAEILVATETYSYGAAGEMLIGREISGIADLTATRVTDGNGLGKIATETERSGATRSYTYDAQGRLTTEARSSGFGGLSETDEYTYDSSSGGEYPVDLRPRTIVRKIAGNIFKTETFAYNDNATAGRTRTHSVTANNTTLTSETRHYPATLGTVSAGRVQFEIRPDGTATHTEYSQATFAQAMVSGYTQTETSGIWENNAFVIVPGKSTRTVRIFDARGNETRTESYVRTATAFELVSWENKTYSPMHKVIAVSRSDGKTSSADYICTGAVWIIDENGIRTDNTFDSAKRLKTSTRHGSRGDVVTTYNYDAQSRIVSETQTTGTLSQNISRSYNVDGSLATETDALGNTTSYTRSADGLIETVTQPDGATRITTRTANGETLSVTGTAVIAHYYSYGFENGLKTTTLRTGAPDSARWEKTYVDGHARTTRTERPGFGEHVILTADNTYTGTRLIATAATGQPSISYLHDALGNVIETTQTAGTQWRKTSTDTVYEKDSDGIIWQTTSETVSCSDATIAAQTTVSKTQLSGLSLALESKQVLIDVRGNATITTSAYSLADKTRTQTTTLPHISGTQSEITVDGVITSQTAPGNVTTSATYDAFNRRLSSTDARGNVTAYAYDIGNRLLSQTQTINQTAVTTSFAYDSMGRLTRTTLPDGTWIASAYDLRGNKTAEYGNASYPVLFVFDELNQKTQMSTFRTLAGSPEELANLTGGDATIWAYDSATGLLLSKTDAANHATTYAYTASGLLAARTWARNVTTTYLYDAWNQLTGTAYSDATQSFSQSYDALGRTVSASDAAGTRTLAYNTFGTLSGETSSALNTTQSITYDTYGRETTCTIAQAGSSTALFGQSYDATTGRLATAAYGNLEFAYGYLAGTHLVAGLANAFVTKSIVYDADRDLPTEIAFRKSDNSLLAKRHYTYDSLGRVTQRSQTRGTNTPRNDVFGYNSRSELTSATLGNDNYAYAFDHIGNRNTANEIGTQKTYATNTLNQYATIADVVGEQTENFVPTYDADGNATRIQTSTGTWQITYNGENRPIRFENAGTQTIVECVYDSQGRRFEKKVTVANAVTLWERYLYRGYLQIAAFAVSSSGETENHTLKHVIYWDPSEPVATRPLAINIIGDGTYFPTVDLTKNVCELVDSSGNLAATYDYAPFGKVTATETIANPLQWSSEIYDSELDLVYYNYRHYSPTDGRFLSRDPIEEQGGLNLYCFVGNMLIKFSDYLGLAFRYETLWYRQNESIFSGPGFWDQVNLKWFPRSEDPEDYTAWFSKRFPKTIAGAKKDLIDRILNYIKENLCSTNSKTFDINALGEMNDIDVAPDMRRYGDVPQNIYERFICIGHFELKVKNINIEWTEEQNFSFTATMYVWEQTGVSPNEGEYGSCLSPFFKKRHIEMGTWSISGNGGCCEN